MHADYYHWPIDGLEVCESGHRRVVIPWRIVALMYWRMRVCGMDHIDAGLNIPNGLIGGRRPISMYLDRPTAAFILNGGQAWVL